ncbi:MAG: Zn-dependent hydrolase [Betaproteobacteria bacterium RIFCSPLOWO2_02_FULL_67_26]|nr:MAG: Zn-dependent hydrolase [Betaproteobacteria bacterium RIFCSPLOWO2_02_FULL_67_26]
MREAHQDAVARVSEERLWRRHMEMARIGAIPGNGVNRAALSREDIAARGVLIGWARDRKFEVGVDAIGNLFVRRPGRDRAAAAVMTGSHMDSQPRGGRFDGIYGVLAGLEALQAIDEAGVSTRRPIELVAWTNEEGGRFPPCTMGSAVYTGARKLEDFLDVTDNDGVALRDALARTLAAAPGLALRPLNAPAAAYIEAHIEQGPLLENAGRTIGVVTGIQGLRWFNIEVSGRTDHAGTTPLALRRDALRDAVNIINALHELTRDAADAVRFTVGRMLVTPNSPNSVASHVLFSVDVRHPDPATIDRLGKAVEPAAKAAAKQCTVKVTPTLHDDPCGFDPGVVDAVERAANGLKLRSMRLPSGASHDAMYMARVCPAGMIFVPCENGVSHNEAENASAADLAAGARVLTAALLELANKDE